MSQGILEPKLNLPDQSNGRWMTIIFNNDFTPIDLVIQVLIAATKCPRDEAEIETWDAHMFGKAPVHFASQEECTEVALKISRIGVQTEVCKEWDE